ncbi:AcrR family transcriptional regulator [Kineosphaera limosa]|uniref:TetR/AcrR family transcriptional regulator n=1 Tax=Kineosphaera limosa TaxID=111564 RepID=UPI0006901BFC|nr:TetR family transcriptional regulator [Kineosphaera limosa]NYE01316.1 AcrR family transcriptional regulator [Kineosphaera limosa]
MRPARSGAARAESTRELLLTTAERLYAQRGLAHVSNRLVAQEAGQANNSAVAYHVGSKDDLVRTICRGHAEAVSAGTVELVAAARDSRHARDHVAALVLPYTRHLAALGSPCWAARFIAQVLADPVHGPTVGWHEGIVAAHAEGGTAMWSFAPPLPGPVVTLRLQMMRLLVVHTCAEQEADADALGRPVDWEPVGEALVDALTGVLLAPHR